MVCHFFPMAGASYLWNALAAAQELRESMRRLSKDWQLRKGWSRELYMNIGIDEGQEWLGTFRSASNVEFTALAETINQAARISDFSRYGAIWATKNLVVKLSADERQRLKYGVRRKNHEGEHVFVQSVFSDVLPLTHHAADGGAGGRLDIAFLPITEIVEIAADRFRQAGSQ
jgi:adenylate cyclase